MAGKDSASTADNGSTSDTRDPTAPAISETDMPQFMGQDEAADLLAGSIESLLNLGSGEDDRPDDDQDDDQSAAGDEGEDGDDDDQAEGQSDDDAEDETDDEDDETAEDDDQGEDDQSDDDSEVESASGLFARDKNGKLIEASLDAIEVDLEIGGEQETKTLAELRDGYMRTDDYTRKTQQFAQRVAEEVQQGLQDGYAKIDERANELDVIIQTFTADFKDPPNFQDLLRKNGGDPEAAGRQFDSINKLRDRMASARAAVEENQKRKQTQENRTLADNAERTLKILKESIPEWKNPKVFKKEETEITAYLNEMGMTQQDLVRIMQDVKYANALRDAVYGRKMRNKKPAVRRKREVAAKRTKRTQTGRPVRSRNANDRAQLRKQARQGDEQAAVSLIEAIL